MTTTLKSVCRLPMLWHYLCSAIAWKWLQCWWVSHILSKLYFYY